MGKIKLRENPYRSDTVSLNTVPILNFCATITKAKILYKM
jgi:hypothetical protein